MVVLFSCGRNVETIDVYTTSSLDSVKPVAGKISCDLNNAIEMADSLISNGTKKINIRLHPGVHRIANTINIENLDSKILFIGTDSKTIISGAIKKEMTNIENDQYKLLLSSQQKPAQLYNGHEKLTLARFPNDSLITLKYTQSDSVYNGDYIVVSKHLFHLLKQIPTNELSTATIRYYYKWMVYNFEIEGLYTDSLLYQVDYKNQSVNLIASNLCGDFEDNNMKTKELLKKHGYFHFEKYLIKVDGKLPEIHSTENPRFFIEGANCFLDKTGEWAQSNNTIYIKSNGTSKHQVIEIPVLQKLISIESTNNISFRNISFAYSSCAHDYNKIDVGQAAYEASAAIEISNAKNIQFENCTFSNLGSYAIWMKQGCTYNSIINCAFKNTGAGAVKIGALKNKDSQPTHITVEQCQLESGGKVFPNAVAIWIGNSSNNEILNNTIFNYLYSAISVGWTWGYGESNSKNNQIKGNHIFDIGQGALSDLGGIYTLGISDGTKIESNTIHHISSYVPEQGHGLYADEGSSNLIFSNNIVYNCSGAGFHLHYGRNNTLQNNIFAMNKTAQISCSGAEQHKMLTICNNIIYFEGDKPLAGPWEYIWANMHHNAYWSSDSDAVLFAGRNLKEWQDYHRDEKSIIENPKFEDLVNYNFNIRNKKLPKAINFENIPNTNPVFQ